MTRTKLLCQKERGLKKQREIKRSWASEEGGKLVGVGAGLRTIKLCARDRARMIVCREWKITPDHKSNPDLNPNPHFTLLSLVDIEARKT